MPDKGVWIILYALLSCFCVLNVDCVFLKLCVIILKVVTICELTSAPPYANGVLHEYFMVKRRKFGPEQ